MGFMGVYSRFNISKKCLRKNLKWGCSYKINDLQDKGFITWRKRIDELRIWEGSDFDIENELTDQAEVLNISLADLLDEYGL